MPRIAASIDIDKPPATVWESFDDARLVADCMPGVEFGEQVSDSRFTGTLRTKIGAMSARFEGQAEIVDRNDQDRSGRIEAKGVDKRGGSRASATVSYRVHPADGAGSRVEVEADIKLQGALAQFGRTGILTDISTQLMKEFADTLQKKLSAETKDEADKIEASEVRPIRLFFASLWARIRKFFRRKRITRT